ncbi:MAG: hypothetical protein JSR78_07565 [Proteobacteria bacterium]|nr:hypothetical protein [Pseudomonadota bacterium]
MSKRYRTARRMRAKLQNLHNRSEFVAGLDAGVRAATTAMAPVDRPAASVDLDAGRWVRDPATGDVVWVRTGDPI